MFQELKEGIIIPEEARYFPYRATFDFQCYFNKEKTQELRNTDKLNWEPAHVPLSASVCSNVPGYQAPKCFVTDGDPNGLISEFIQYFVSISTKSYSLLREQYADVFEALKTATGPESQEAQEDQLAQMVEEIEEGNTDSEVESEEGEESEDQSKDIDLMASDNEEDEEEIESEN